MTIRDTSPEDKLTEEELLDAQIPDVIARPQAQEPNFLQKGRLNFKQTIKEASDWSTLRKTPYKLMPMILLTGIVLAQDFDATAYGLLLPDIIRDLDIEVGTILQILNFIATLTIFASIGVAYFADRYRRTPMVGISAIVAGIFAGLTGRANSVGGLGVGRVGESLGRSVTRTPVGSLLADYYPPEVRGKAFAFYGTLVGSVTLFAPLLVGITATRTSWRVPFFIAAVGMIITGIMALLFLREPVRGFMERRALGADEQEALMVEEPPSLGEAWRTVWAIRTLRRIFIANIFDGAGIRIFGLFYVLYLFDEYGMGISERAVLATFSGFFAIAGGFLGGGLVDSLMRRRPQRVLILLGALGLAASLALVVIVSSPPVWLLYVIYAVFGFSGSLLGPATSVIYAQILPASIRNLGLAVQALSLIPGGLLVAVSVGFLLERYGFQGTLAAAIPFYMISSIIQMSAASFFDRDMRAALAANMASEEWRKAKAGGRGKLLVCRNVDVEYDGVQVLFGVDFDVEEGDIIALLGTNGAGKSTLLRAISGTQEASGGAIVMDGRDITHMPPHEIANRAVIHMPGGRGVFPGLSVKENLLLGNWMSDPEEGKQRLAEVYDIFPILKERQNESAGTLSGGEQQMVSLAQAFLGKPKLLMIDELSLGLSPAVVQQLIEIVRRIHATGVTIIVVEQSVNVALTIAERAIFMEKGEVKFVGKTKELLSRPDILRAIYVKGSGALTQGAPATAMKTERELRQYELGMARPILEVKGVSRSYGGIKAVKNVSFELREGEALGLIGPNGAGKTTLFDLISGFQKPDEGQILFEGLDITTLRPDQRAAKRLVRRFQDARLFPSLTVYENLLVALDQKLDFRSIVLTTLQVPQVRQSERRVRLRADRLIDLLELGAYRDKFVKELSTGLRRIVDIACVLAAEPKVLMLDEPSSGIAQAESEGLGPLLRRVRFETGCSMLVIEHDMPLISAISDQLIALDQGAFVMRGSPQEVLDDDRVIRSYLGTSEEVVKRSGILE